MTDLPSHSGLYRRIKEIALTSVVCKYSCHILKDRLATVVKEKNLVGEELLVASGKADVEGTKLFH